jgi:hypothetical protein
MSIKVGAGYRTLKSHRRASPVKTTHEESQRRGASSFAWWEEMLAFLGVFVLLWSRAMTSE